MCSSDCGFAFERSKFAEVLAYFKVEGESIQNRMNREREAAEEFLGQVNMFGLRSEQTAMARLTAANDAGEISMSEDDIISTARDEGFAASATYLVNNHVSTDAHNHISRSIKSVEGPRPTMTANYGDLRSSAAAQRASNTRLDASLTSANNDACHFNLNQGNLHEQQMLYDRSSSKPAAAPLDPGRAPSSDDSAQPYVDAAIKAAIEEQAASDDEEDTERMEGLASVINALSDRNSPRYSSLLNILKFGNGTNMEKLLTLCIRALKVK